jgi:hypothetical protein
MDGVVCADCKREYPDELTAPFNGRIICGICALAATNAMHGTSFTSFQGEAAEDMRLDCIAYNRDRQDHQKVPS